MSDYKSVLEAQRQKVISFAKHCLDESRTVEKDPRRNTNKLNWNYFHGTVDWSHKEADDPKIHLHKVGVAAERMRAKIKGALMKYDNWLSVERRYQVPGAILPEYAAKNLVIKQLERAKGKNKFSDAILRGALESRIALKISGEYITAPRFVANEAGELVRKEKEIWQLDLPVLGFEQLHIDVDNQEKPIYIIEEGEVPKHEVLALASEGGEESGKPYMLEALKDMKPVPMREDAQEAERAAKGMEELIPRMKERQTVVVHNFYGTVLDDDGSILKWQKEDGSEVPLQNVCFVMANENSLLLDPKRNTRISAKAPYVYSDIIRSPNNGRKALMDAGTLINKAVDELFSLMLAGALKATHNVTWYRKQWLEDKRQVSGGIKDGASLAVNESAPPGYDPVGVVETGKVPQEAFGMQNTLERVFAENVLSSQTDMGQSNTADKLATELVQMNAATTDIFDSIGGDIEEGLIGTAAEEILYEIVQNLDDIDPDEIKGCFGANGQQQAEQFLQMKPRERFDQVRGMFRFTGKGLRGLIANQAKAQGLINLVNTIMANPLTAQAVESQLSVTKLLYQVAKGFGLDIEELAPSPEEMQMIQQKQLIREQALAMSEVMGRDTAKSGGAKSPSGTQPGSSGAVTGSGSQTMA